MTHPGRVQRTPLFCWHNSGTANSLRSELDRNLDRAVAQAENITEDDRTDARLEEKILAPHRIKDHIEIDFGDVVVEPISEEQLSIGVRDYEATLRYRVQSGKKWLHLHPDNWPTDQRVFGHIDGDEVILVNTWKPKDATAAAINEWRATARKNFADVVSRMNEMLDDANAELEVAVRAVLRSRRDQLDKLAALRRELGEG